MTYEEFKKLQYKAESKEENLLTEEESIKELARMLGGVRITDAVVQNAREMHAFI